MQQGLRIDPQYATLLQEALGSRIMHEMGSANLDPATLDQFQRMFHQGQADYNDGHGLGDVVREVQQQWTQVRGQIDADEKADDEQLQVPTSPIKFEWDLNLSRNPAFRFRPDPAPVFDTANAAQFHSKFLVNASRNETLVLAGDVRVEVHNKSVTFTAAKLSGAARGSILNIVQGQFPMGGQIKSKRYSSATLPRAVLSRLPGVVTVRR